MTYIDADVDKLQKQPLVGTGTCVDLIKELVPGLIGQSTQVWKQGENVMDAHKAGKAIRRGTAIATFDNGRYPQRCEAGYNGSCHHAALVLTVQDGGIWIMDQYNTDSTRMFVDKRFLRIPMPSERKLPNGKWKNAGNNPLAFYVISK